MTSHELAKKLLEMEDVIVGRLDQEFGDFDEVIEPVLEQNVKYWDGKSINTLSKAILI